MKLLIVDDEFFVIQGIMNGVNWDVLQYGEVLQANSYAQAVELLENTPVEVILCDIEMPDESGLELIGWVNDHRPDTECIILSCHDEFDFARRAVQLNCFDYILKPARYDFLTEVLFRAGNTAADKHKQAELENYGKLYIGTLAGSGKDGGMDVVEKTADYIERHFTEELSVKMLADMAFISPDHLTRSFKKRYRLTVSDYILKKRMKMAEELLEGGGLTVTMVSDRVGFGNYSYFTEQFKKAFGMTPREFQSRKRIQERRME